MMAKRAETVKVAATTGATSAVLPDANTVIDSESDASDLAVSDADIEPINHLERVRALKEVPTDQAAVQMLGGIEYFKDSDGRTMRVCVADRELCKQEFIEQNTQVN